MTIHEMQIFVETARSGGMSAAARNLFIAQSTVSQCIRSIEQRYGVTLFERGSRHFSITPQGALALDYCQQILELHRKLERELTSSGDSLIRIGFSLIASSCILPTLLPNYHRACPDVRTQICVEEEQSLQTRLLSGQLDFAVLENPMASPGLVSQAVFEDPYVLVCGSESPFFRRQSVELAELRGQRLVLRERGNPTRELFEKATADDPCGFEPETLYNVDVIKAEVAAGQGVSILARRLISGELMQGQLHGIPIRDFPYRRTFYLVFSQKQPAAPYLQQFRAHCQELI